MKSKKQFYGLMIIFMGTMIGCNITGIISSQDAIATKVAETLEKSMLATKAAEVQLTYTLFPTYTPYPTYTPVPTDKPEFHSFSFNNNNLPPSPPQGYNKDMPPNPRR